jgi:hypothetical protein
VAKKTISVDDLDGSENDVMTHRFSLDSDHSEIDLYPQNLAGLPSPTPKFELGDNR